MSFLFGGARPSPANTIKHYQREINKHCRSMERENNRSLSSEKGIISEIKKHAMKNDIHMAKLKAKELIRARNFRKRLCITQQGLASLGQQLAILETSQRSQEVLEKTTRILQALNNKMDLGATYKMLMEFEKQSTTLDEKQEILNESMDNMFEIDESEVDSTLGSVFEELGVDLKNNLKGPMRKGQEEEDVEERYARLVSQRV